MDKKPPVVIDESTELKFCTVSCYQKAQKDYLQVLRSKWSEFKAIENWILLNKGPAHDQATLIALMKILCMRAQDCDKFYDIDTMVNRGVQLDNLDKFTKIVHSKLKAQNVFLETNHKELLRWAGQIAANFQLGTVSAIKPWIQRVKEIRVLSKLQHAEVLKEFKDFDGCAKRIYEKYIERKKIQKNQSRCVFHYHDTPSKANFLARHI